MSTYYCIIPPGTSGNHSIRESPDKKHNAPVLHNTYLLPFDPTNTADTHDDIDFPNTKAGNSNPKNVHIYIACTAGLK